MNGVLSNDHVAPKSPLIQQKVKTMYKEKDIIHEAGKYWVCRDTRQNVHIVFKNGVTHATSDSCYPLTSDGLSLAIARCNYLASRKA